MGLPDLRELLERRRMKRRAGRRARDKYKALRKAWLRENRKVFAVLAAAGLAVVAGWHLVLLWWPGEQAWMAGVLAGAFGAGWYTLRLAPPPIIENWQQGAWGEEFTADELAKIAGRSWTVLNDLPNGRYNFDHVVIGPAGVFCLSSKKSSQRLEVASGGGRLRLTNRFDASISTLDDRMLDRARSDASALSNRIAERTGQRVWVQPVIVWWGEFPDRRRIHRQIGLVHGRELVDWLDHQPIRTPVDVETIASSIRPGRRRKTPGLHHVS